MIGLLIVFIVSLAATRLWHCFAIAGSAVVIGAIVGIGQVTQRARMFNEEIQWGVDPGGLLILLFTFALYLGVSFAAYRIRQRWGKKSHSDQKHPNYEPNRDQSYRDDP